MDKGEEKKSKGFGLSLFNALWLFFLSMITVLVVEHHRFLVHPASFQIGIDPLDELLAMEVFGYDATLFIQEIVCWDGGDAEGLEEWRLITQQVR